MHTKDRMAHSQMETTLAVLGDDRRYPTEERTMFGFKKPKRDTLSFDTKGWTVVDESPAHRMWQTENDDAVRHQFVDSTPVNPFDLSEVERPRKFYANQCDELGGVMLSMDVDTFRGVEYLRGVFKYRSPEEGSMAMYYVGMIVVLFRDFHYQINTESVERGTTGAREAAVMAMGDGPPRSTEPPQVLESMDDFFAASRSRKPIKIPADDPKYDSAFPEHPLTKVRDLQSRILGSLQFPEWLPSKPRFRYNGG